MFFPSWLQQIWDISMTLRNCEPAITKIDTNPLPNQISAMGQAPVQNQCHISANFRQGIALHSVQCQCSHAIFGVSAVSVKCGGFFSKPGQCHFFNAIQCIPSLLISIPLENIQQLDTTSCSTKKCV